MKALILAGGLATRLRPLSERVPKSLLPIGNRPFLEHQLRLLALHGVRDVILLTGYLAADFDAFLPRAAALGAAVTVSTETAPLGTAGAARSVLDDLDETTIVFNGDILTDLDLSAFLAMHRERGSLVSIALTHVPDATTYGLVEHDDVGRISAFLEKDPVRGANGGWINAGTYILEPKALAEIPSETRWSFEYQVFPSLLAAGEPLYGFRSEAYWLDIGTRERVLQAHADLAAGRFPGQIDGRIVDAMELPDGTVIEGRCILAHAAVEPGAHLGPDTCIAAGASVGAGARVERSVVYAGARVGARAIVRDSIIGPGAVVVDDAIVEGQIIA